GPVEDGLVGAGAVEAVGEHGYLPPERVVDGQPDRTGSGEGVSDPGLGAGRVGMNGAEGVIRRRVRRAVLAGGGDEGAVVVAGLHEVARRAQLRDRVEVARPLREDEPE